MLVGQRVLLQTFLHHAVGDFDAVAAGLHHKLKDIEQLACIATAVTQQGTGLLENDAALLQLHIFRHRPVKQSEEVVLVERLEHIHLTARQQRSYHLERGVFRRCAYQRDDSPLHRPEQRVLLRLTETVYFVDEEYG